MQYILIQVQSLLIKMYTSQSSKSEEESSSVWGTYIDELEVDLFASCLTAQLPHAICQLETRPRGDGDGCLLNGLVPIARLCQSTMEPSGESPRTSLPSTSQTGPNSSRLESTTMVCSSTRNAHRDTDIDCGQDGPDPGNSRGQPSGHHTSASRVGYLRERYRSHQLSEKATELLLASWRQKSSKTYDSLFRKWIGWCNQRDSDPVSGPVSEVVNFSSRPLSTRISVQILELIQVSNFIRIHDKVDGYTVGQHPLITRLLKGAFHTHPPLPKYSHTWDVNVVTTYLNNLGENTSLSLPNLTRDPQTSPS